VTVRPAKKAKTNAKNAKAREEVNTDGNIFKSRHIFETLRHENMPPAAAERLFRLFGLPRLTFLARRFRYGATAVQAL
jgi:hypothetical protein